MPSSASITSVPTHYHRPCSATWTSSPSSGAPKTTPGIELAAGGVLRTYEGENPALTLDLVENRLTARVDAGNVAEVRGYG